MLDLSFDTSLSELRSGHACFAGAGVTGAAGQRVPRELAEVIAPACRYSSSWSRLS